MTVRRLLPLSDLLLFAVAMVWGSSYGIVKSALAFYPVLGLLALRFGVTFCLLAVNLRHLRHASAATLRGVLVLGLLLLSIFLAETFGVLHTRAANAAFLISLCVVLTPLVEWALLKRRPGAAEWLAVGVSFAGAWLLASDGALSFDFNAGDGLILAAAVLRALSVCVTKRVLRAAPLPALTVTAVQAGVVASAARSSRWFSRHRNGSRCPLSPVTACSGDRCCISCARAPFSPSSRRTTRSAAAARRASRS